MILRLLICCATLGTLFAQPVSAESPARSLSDRGVPLADRDTRVLAALLEDS